jgi:hypothetical protein
LFFGHQQLIHFNLRYYRYGLFAALSFIMKKDIAHYLEVLVTFMIGSLKSTEGVQVREFIDRNQTTLVQDLCIWIGVFQLFLRSPLFFL